MNRVNALIAGCLMAMVAAQPAFAAVDGEKLLTEPGLFGTFAVFKVDDSWWKLDKAARTFAATEVKAVFQKHGDNIITDALFLQGEDGIRDLTVTGVQTCALPIWRVRTGYGLLLAALLPGAVLAQVTDTASYLQRMDSDGDGKVSEAEYVQWMLYAFDRMDRNGDGVLTAEELPGGKGRAISREQQRQVIVKRFHTQDANGDGFLDARELAAPPR